jgi:hypothetical protein
MDQYQIFKEELKFDPCLMHKNKDNVKNISAAQRLGAGSRRIGKWFEITFTKFRT